MLSESNMPNKSVLITGANGLLGRELIKTLASYDYKIVATVRSKEASDKLSYFLDHNNISNVCINTVSDIKKYKEICADIDALVHCAGRAHILKDKSFNPEKEFNATNSALPTELIRICIDHKVKRFIYISSIGVNGSNTGSKPFNEQSLLLPETHYAKSKLNAEQNLKLYANQIELVIIRPPMIIGPDAKGNFNRLVKAIVQRWPLPLGNIKNKRQYMGVRNLTLFVKTCLESAKAVNQTFLIANDEVLSTTQLVKEMAQCLNVKAFILPIPPTILYLILRLLGKKNEYNQLAGNLEISLDYPKKRLNWQQPFTLNEELKYSLAVNRKAE